MLNPLLRARCWLPSNEVIKARCHVLVLFQNPWWQFLAKLLLVHEAFWAETETKTEALKSEAEARPRHWKFLPRRGRGEALVGLEAASRPRHQDRGHIPGIITLNCERVKTSVWKIRILNDLRSKSHPHRWIVNQKSKSLKILQQSAWKCQ